MNSYDPVGEHGDHAVRAAIIRPQTTPVEMTIPVDDASAALAFCRNLSAYLHDLSKTPRLQASQEDTLPVLSVVIPVFNEEDNLPALCERLAGTLAGCGLGYEIVFVDDGSRDGSVTYLRQQIENGAPFTLVELSRNFGHQVAISAGLDYARGQGIIIMDADLQDPPEVLPAFIAKWQEGHDVVYAIREQRKEGWIKRQSYALFYRLLHQMANIEIPLDAGDFCIMDRRVVDLLNTMPERNRFVRGIRSWVGLDQIGLAYERQARYAGTSKYTFSRLMYLALDGFVSFSFMPLRTISIAGFAISGMSLALAVFYAVKRLLVGLNPPGFASLMVVNFFFAGVNLITMGVIGEYVGRIFQEVKQRPLYVVRRVIGR